MWLGVPGDSACGEPSDKEKEEEDLYHSCLLSLFSLFTSFSLHGWAPETAQSLIRQLLKASSLLYVHALKDIQQTMLNITALNNCTYVM